MWLAHYFSPPNTLWSVQVGPVQSLIPSGVGKQFSHLHIICWEDSFLSATAPFQPVLIHQASQVNEISFLEGKLSVINKLNDIAVSYNTWMWSCNTRCELQHTVSCNTCCKLQHTLWATTHAELQQIAYFSFFPWKLKLAWAFGHGGACMNIRTVTSQASLAGW